MLEKLIHPAKAPLPIKVKLDGSDILNKLEHPVKALSPIEVKSDESVIFFKPLQLLKA